jgi:peptide/nickel transport system permease protein
VRLGGIALALLSLVAVCASALAPNDPERQFTDRAYAPPTLVRVWHDGALRAPFIYPQMPADRLMRTYRADATRPAPLRWFQNGRLVTIEETSGPLLILGADALGRDVFSRLLHGARLSLGVAFFGVVGAIAIGAIVGALAGGLGGTAEQVLMLLADFVIVLPGAYVVLILRGILPDVLSTAAVFAVMAALFALAAWPHAARGVRAIVAAERVRDYAEAARAAGAGPLRLTAHLLPAARGFLGVEVALLLPALLVAEATVSYLGLGFPEPVASWGTLLQDAANVRALSTAPWLMSPAVALFVTVLAVQLIVSRRAPASVLLAARNTKLSGYAARRDPRDLTPLGTLQEK